MFVTSLISTFGTAEERGAEGVSGWGGAGQAESMVDAMRLAQAKEEIILEIEGRPPARALVVGLRNADIVLAGNGPYPIVDES